MFGHLLMPAIHDNTVPLEDRGDGIGDGTPTDCAFEKTNFDSMTKRVNEGHQEKLTKEARE